MCVGVCGIICISLPMIRINVNEQVIDGQKKTVVDHVSAFAADDD